MVKYAIAATLIITAAAQAVGGSEIVLLDFSSPHCGPCRQMLPTIQNLEAAGYKVRLVDTTQEPALAQQYQVTRIPCFIMLADGQETERLVGATSQEQLVAMYQRAMQLRTQSPDGQLQIAAAQSAAPQTGVDPWSGLGTSAPNNFAGIGEGSAPARPVMSAVPLSPREPLKDAFSSGLIQSSVRLRVDDSTGHSYGTGTMIDARSGEALVITCGHLFRESKGKGPVMVELFAVTAEGVRVVAQVPGNVIDYNLDRDLGLVSIQPNMAVRVAPIASTETVVERGQRMTSVGCDHGKDPSALAARVTNVNRYQGPPNIEASGAPVEGRSGGGLFNSAGELVGVCFAADYEGNEGLYTALESIHDEMDRLGLSEVYRKSNGTAPTQNVATTPLTSATPPIVRGQEPLEPVVPVAQLNAIQIATLAGGAALQATTPIAPPNQLAPAEQAALDEIVRRAVDSEVVCIIRPKDPSGKSEVITLDRVSPEFVRALAKHREMVIDTMRR